MVFLFNPGRPRSVRTKWGLRCGHVCGPPRLRSDLHYLPRSPQMSSASCVPPHLLQEMHPTVAKKVLNIMSPITQQLLDGAHLYKEIDCFVLFHPDSRPAPAAEIRSIRV